MRKYGISIIILIMIMMIVILGALLIKGNNQEDVVVIQEVVESWTTGETVATKTLLVTFDEQGNCIKATMHIIGVNYAQTVYNYILDQQGEGKLLHTPKWIRTGNELFYEDESYYGKTKQEVEEWYRNHPIVEDTTLNQGNRLTIYGIIDGQVKTYSGMIEE